MSILSRREVLSGLLTATGATLLGSSVPTAAEERRVIELTARRFVFEPDEIALKAGEPVVIAIRALDFTHGMNIPDLGRRLDLVPGRVSRLELQPMAPGVIDFLCDNFCGEGHEGMHGRFVVTA